MGKFSEGYEFALKLQNNKISSEEYAKELKNLIGKNSLNDCKEWYHGFHNALLQVDLMNLENAFKGLKEKAEKSKNGE